jgi:hypothetical protein
MRTRPRRGYAAMLPDRRPHHRRSRSAQPCRRSRTRHRLRCTGADIGTELIDPSVSSAASSTWATSAAPKPQPTAGGRGLRMRRWRWPPRRAASAQRRVRGRERDAVADGHPRRHRQHGGDLAAQQRPEARAGDAQRCAGQQRAESGTANLGVHQVDASAPAPHVGKCGEECARRHGGCHDDAGSGDGGQLGQDRPQALGRLRGLQGRSTRRANQLTSARRGGA